MKVSFSLNQSRAPKPVAASASLAPRTTFGSLDDDEPLDAAPTSSSKNASVTANKKFLAQNVQPSRSLKKKMEAEMLVDETVYQYDEVWDDMQEAKQRQKEVKQRDSAQRQPKYIKGLLEMAETRRLDHLRAEEKMMQRERDMEGDEFKDKEAFVTQAYKDQMAEVRKAEEEEKLREERRRQQGTLSTGMTHFYRKLLEDSEEKHDATVAATQKRVYGPQGPNLTITRPKEMTPLSDLELARLAELEGKSVELNDDNQIVDKRDLLSAGLNLSGVNTRRLGQKSDKVQKQELSEPVNSHRAVGTAASRQAINSRRVREIHDQMQEEEVRSKETREREEREAIQRVVTKRNNESDVQSARERYLQRKRARLEAPEEPTQ